MRVIRKRATFCFVTKKRDYVLQFSTKKPWLLPKSDRKFMDGKLTLFGWLFVYFGWWNKKYF